MKRVVFALCMLCVMLCGCTQNSLKGELKGVLEQATEAYKAKAALVESGAEGYPYAVSGGEQLSADGDKQWAKGYLPGALWMLAEWCDDDELRETAQVLTYKLNNELQGGNLHDYAMIVNAAHYKIYKQRQTNRLFEAMDAVGRSSSNAYAMVYCTMQNVESDPEYFHRTAVWNMPTLEFLYELGWKGNVNIHAQSVMANQVREDGALYEGQIYNKYAAKPLEFFSLHGQDARSAWSRGQAWALYGFAMLYRVSGDEAYLKQAERTAKYIMANLAEDGIPNWDFDSQEEMKDSSAAAIMASAFVDLYRETKNEEYLQIAERQLSTLCSAEYLASAEECGGLLLKHGVGNRMTGDAVDAALIWGDYYLIEAITKYLEL